MRRYTVERAAKRGPAPIRCKKRSVFRLIRNFSPRRGSAGQNVSVREPQLVLYLQRLPLGGPLFPTRTYYTSASGSEYTSRHPDRPRSTAGRRPRDANKFQCGETKGNANHTWTDSRVRHRDRRAFTHATRNGNSRLRPPITPRVIRSVHLVRTCTPREQSCTDYGGWARMQHAACIIAHGRAYQVAAWRSQPHP